MGNGHCGREAEEALTRMRRKNIRKGGGGTFERIRRKWAGRGGGRMMKKEEEEEGGEAEEDEDGRARGKRRPGSASPERKVSAGRAETEFIGWTYC